MFAFILSVLVAVAQPPATYNVYITPRFESFGYAGTMTLSFPPGGYVNGSYRDAGSAIPRPVTGSVKGKDIHLTVPTLGRLSISGRIEPNGDIDGSGTALSGSSSTLYVFTASLDDRSRQSPHR